MTTLTRAAAEDFLYHEAELLDDWKLQEWADLFRSDGLYEVTSPASTDPVEADARTSLFLISDGMDRIRGRATRLLKKTAHAEYPHSKTRHMVGNVRVSPGENGEILVRGNLVVYRTKEDNTTVFMGETRYRLVQTAEGLRIVQKRVILDLNSLVAQGRLTIIL
ncbi:MAG TPA: aromatic-ring-hydroxylating dioxygenase subunit beta [Nevskiaceae bacterium]|nr:aromatic-ring-hydroxylating dioxygenase subunit beta [Nevskiaceae bacterium]